MNRSTTRFWRLAVSFACSLAAIGLLADVSVASGPVFRVYLRTPDSVSSGESVSMGVVIQNIGSQTTSGPIHFSDTAGLGLTVPQEEYGTGATSSQENVPAGPTTCETAGQTLNCESAGPLPPGAQMFMNLTTAISTEATGTLTNSVVVSGGGALESASAEEKMTVGPQGPFGFTLAAAQLLDSEGATAWQAGSDPSEFTTSLLWRTAQAPFWFSSVMGSVEHFKDVVTHLPPGLIGNPSATPVLCTADELAEFDPAALNISNCPLDSQVGVARVYLGDNPAIVALYNMVPPHGVATELGFQLYETNVLLYAYVRPSDHGIDIVTRDTSTSAPITGVDITVWGVPSDPSHDVYRGTCLNTIYRGSNGLSCPTSAPRRAFLRLPTSCSGAPLPFGVESNSYEKPQTWASASFTAPALSGCDALPFDPEITVDPTGRAANSPTGVSVKVSLPQNQNPDGLAEADLKKAVVTLPEGMALNPSSADGLMACDDAHLHLDSNTPAECPDGSKVGTVLLHTQLISNPIEGLIYLRPQNSQDPMSGEMFRIVLELRDDEHGLDFKIPGRIQANPVTGRLTTTFDDNPQLPFEDISLHFKAGARAPLVTPASCASQTTEADLYSWAKPNVPVHRSSRFQLTSGPEGTPCVSSLPFAPGFSAGSNDVEAGNYTPFLVTFKRADADQGIRRVSVKMPQGLLGSLAGLPLCGDAQANAGTCSAQSQIGTMTAGAGAGPTPFYVTGGRVYMTGPYEGAPFGLSIVVPAKAGPFDLGTVVVRAKVEVDPQTAQLTVTTDPLPQVVGGVPVDLRLVNVTINRPNFAFNPTDCNHTDVTGTMTGNQGAVASVVNGFQVTNCAALGFKPKFRLTTRGETSRSMGASLDARLSYPKAPFGSQANIAKVKVSLPRQLPSRLKTLQKACPAEVFDANPAVCPSASRIGTAIAHTPVLPVPLTGPVYFVSHGGQAFPDLIVVLQGYGVTVDLVGTTFISKKAITSTTFNTVPDVPIGSFELKLPQGPDSALAANGDLCTARKLVMPTLFIAQDGQVIHTKTPIAPTGCAKHKKHSKRRRHHREHRRK